MTLMFAPTPVQMAFWENTILVPHELLSLSLVSQDELAVECSYCRGPPVQLSHAPDAGCHTPLSSAP